MTPPNPPTRDRAAAITLTRDGKTATVKVGDVVRLVNGTAAEIIAVRPGRRYCVFGLREQDEDDTLSWVATGQFYPGDSHKGLDIDIEKTAALTRPTAPGDGLAGVVVTEAMRREIAEAWRELVRHTPGINGHDRMADALTAAGYLPLSDDGDS